MKSPLVIDVSRERVNRFLEESGLPPSSVKTFQIEPGEWTAEVLVYTQDGALLVHDDGALTVWVSGELT